MSQIVEATYDGQVFRPTETVELQPNTCVELVVTIKSTTGKSSKSFLRVARSLKLKGPKDWSWRVNEIINNR